MMTVDALLAAVRLSRLLLERSQSHRSGYGYAQSWDAKNLGLMKGEPVHWQITPLGEMVLRVDIDALEQELRQWLSSSTSRPTVT